MKVLNSTTVSTLEQSQAVRILFQAEFFITIKVLAPIWVAIILFGLGSNVINIVVFLKAGAKDNVTLLLLSLAVSDLLFLILITPSMCSFFITALIPAHSWPFDFQILRYLLYWPAFTAYDLSAFISVSLGVMRCACVAMPLKFKLVFTRSRTIKWVMFLVVLAVLLRLPVLTVNRISWRVDPATNISRAYIKAVRIGYMSRINDILNRGFFIYANYITMVTCVAVLTFKLYQAAKIRRACTSRIPETADQAPDTPTDQRLSPKDLQVVKSVALVCTIFILSQLPFLLVSTTRLVNPRFTSIGRLRLLFGLFSQVNRTCSYLNASLNIFVYYNFNSKYRAIFRALFCTAHKQ